MLMKTQGSSTTLDYLSAMNTTDQVQPDATAPVKGLRMLLVEDSARILTFILESLRSEGRYAHIATAATEQEAARLLLKESEHFDVAIIDIQLAQGTGFDVIKTLRMSASKDAYLIVLTNHAYSFYAKVALDLGADEFLDKSKDFSKIQKLIQARFPISL